MMRFLKFLISFLLIKSSWATADLDANLKTINQMIQQRDQALKTLEGGFDATTQNPSVSIKSLVAQNSKNFTLHPQENSEPRNPFAVTPQMMGEGSGTGANLTSVDLLRSIKLKGILLGNHQTALIDTGLKLLHLRIGDEFNLIQSNGLQTLVVRAITINSVEIGTQSKTLVILR